MVALSEVTNLVNDATLTISGTKDLTGEGKKQVLFSLTTTDADSTTMSTFADLNYTSLVITAYKNGTASTNPLEESPLYTRTLQGTQLNKAAINLDITHEETVESASEFVPGTGYVFDVRFMKTGGVTLLRKIHTFQNGPVASDFTFTVSTGSNSLGLKVNTPSDKPKINELFVEIMELDDDNEPKRINGIIDRYSLQKYTAAIDSAFDNDGTDQIIRASGDNSLPNATGDLTQAETYNMNVIIVTDGGTSDKIRMTSGNNPNLLLSNKPNQPKVTIVDMQKRADTDGTADNQALGHYLPSVLVVYEIEGLSAGEVLDKVKLDLRIDGGTALEFDSNATYAANEDGGPPFETDFVTEKTINGVTRKLIALRLTRVADSNDDASSTTLTGTALGAANSDLTVTYPTLATTHTDSGKRTVAQVFEESFTLYSDNGGLGTSINAGGEAILDLKVIQIQVTALDFGVVIDNLNAQISNTSLDGSNGLSNEKNTFILQTDTTKDLAETAAQTSFTTIKMDLTASGGALPSNTFLITQDELATAGNQSFSIQSTTDLLSKFIDNNLVQFVVLNIENAGTKKLFTLDGTTAIDFLTGTAPLTLTDSVAFGADAQTDSLDDYGAIPAAADGAGPGNGNDSTTYLAFSTPVSIVFNGTEQINNIYMTVHLHAYTWGDTNYIGPQTVRNEIGSLVAGGQVVTDVIDDESTDGTAAGNLTKYSGNHSAETVGKSARSAQEIGNAQGLQALFAGTQVSCNNFVSMERVGLTPTVEISQAEKALLTTDLPEITIKVTENIVLDAAYAFGGNTYALAPYDLSNGNMRPSSMNITLTNTNTSASQEFTFTGTTNTTFANLQQTAASGVTAGVYQVTLENGVDVNGQTVSLVPGDTFDIYVALGNAYGITAATTTGFATTRLQTGNPDTAESLTVKTTSHASSGAVAAEVTQNNQGNFTVFDREVGAPTVTIATQSPVEVGGEEIVVNVTANAADIYDTIDYTQLVLEVTTNDGSSTTSTFTYGSEKVLLAAQAGLTVNSKGSYTVTIVNGNAITGGSGNITLTAGHTVTVKATLKTDYSNGIQSDATTATTIQAKASLKTTGTAANYLLADSSDALDALFDVDLIEKTTLQFSPAHANSGVSSPTTWGDLINTNGISTADLALTVTPQYETSADTYEDGTAIDITILNGNAFADLAAVTLNLDNDKVVAMRARATADETTQMKLLFTLTSTFEDDITNTSTLTTAAFQPYLHPLALDDFTVTTPSYTNGENDTLGFTAQYDQRAWKADLKSVTINYYIFRNNELTKTKNLATYDSGHALYQAIEEKADGQTGASSTTFSAEFNPALRGTYVTPVFAIAATTSKANYADTDKQNQSAQVSSIRTDLTKRIATRANGSFGSFVKDSNGKQYASYLPNGNTLTGVFTIDNDGAAAANVSHVTNNSAGVDLIINNNPNNAVFRETDTITLAQSGEAPALSNDVTLVFERTNNAIATDDKTLTLTLGTATPSSVVTSLNTLGMFPAMPLLPGANQEAPLAVWVLGTNIVFKASNGTTLANDALLAAGNTITLIYALHDNSKVHNLLQAVSVANGTNNNCSFSNSISETEFTVLSSTTNNANEAIPIPTLIITPTPGTGDKTHLFGVETSEQDNAGEQQSGIATLDVTLN